MSSLRRGRSSLALAGALVAALIGVHCGGDDSNPVAGGDAGTDGSGSDGSAGGDGSGGSDAGDDGGPVLVNDVPLDSTFGSAGAVDFAAGSDNWDNATAIARQADGKLVVLGSTGQGSDGFGGQAFLFRVSTNGALDTTFGNGGRVLLNVARAPLPKSLLVQPDGKILVAGALISDGVGPVGVHNAFIVRLDGAGALDKSFGGGTGMVATGAAGGVIALGPNGSIVEARVSSTASSIEVARFDASGTLDATFGTGGVAPFAMGDYAEPIHVAVQADGKILVANRAYQGNGVTEQTAIVRLLATGAPDTTLDSDGRLNPAPTAKAQTLLRGFLLQADGTFFVSGAGYDGNNSLPFLAKYTSTGSLDISFATTGVHTEAGSQLGSIDELHALDDGRIAFDGFISDNYVLGRVVATGTSDPAFASGGLATVAGLPIGSSPMRAFTIDPATGKPYMLDTKGSGSGASLVLAPQVRAFGAADGAADTTFGTSDATVVPSNAPREVAAHLVAIPTGGAFFAQRSGYGYDGAIFVWRLGASGAPAGGFGTSGAARIDTLLRNVEGMALSSTGQVILCGGSASLDDVGVAALDPTTGAPDSAFGTGGLFHIGSGANVAAPTDCAVDDSGRIVVGAQSGGAGALVRVLANGTADTSFDSDGVLSVPFDTAAIVRVATAPGGKIVAVSTASSGRLSVVRVTSAGATDGSFTATSAQLDQVTAGAVAVLGDGSVLVSGYTDKAPKGAFLAKLTPALALDASFGTGGIVREPLPYSPPPAPGAHGPVLVPLASGGVMLASATVDRLHEVSYVYRFTATGQLDTAYATAGKGTLVDVGLMGLASQPDGKVLAAGRVWTTTTGIDAWAARLVP